MARSPRSRNRRQSSVKNEVGRRPDLRADPREDLRNSQPHPITIDGGQLDNPSRDNRSNSLADEGLERGLDRRVLSRGLASDFEYHSIRPDGAGVSTSSLDELALSALGAAPVPTLDQTNLVNAAGRPQNQNLLVDQATVQPKMQAVHQAVSPPVGLVPLDSNDRFGSAIPSAGLEGMTGLVSRAPMLPSEHQNILHPTNAQHVDVQPHLLQQMPGVTLATVGTIPESLDQLALLTWEANVPPLDDDERGLIDLLHPEENTTFNLTQNAAATAVTPEAEKVLSSASPKARGLLTRALTLGGEVAGTATLLLSGAVLVATTSEVGGEEERGWLGENKTFRYKVRQDEQIAQVEMKDPETGKWVLVGTAVRSVNEDGKTEIKAFRPIPGKEEVFSEIPGFDPDDSEVTPEGRNPNESFITVPGLEVPEPSEPQVYVFPDMSEEIKRFLPNIHEDRRETQNTKDLAKLLVRWMEEQLPHYEHKAGGYKWNQKEGEWEPSSEQVIYPGQMFKEEIEKLEQDLKYRGRTKGSVLPDLTFEYKISSTESKFVYIQTVDVDENCKPTQRELDNADRLRRATGQTVYLIPKTWQSEACR